ncbi:hypothetical protein JXA88_08545 [Candidatus Fermentibacteria bacterium]|nr:hypothetical protein [Candidatus Fermentibacteria bacterium]
MWNCRLYVTCVLALFFGVSSAKVSVDARDTEIVDVVQGLCAQAQLDVVIGPGVKGKVTLFVSDAEVVDALEALAAAGGWAVYRAGGMYRFVTRDEYERITGLKFAAEMRTEVFTVREIGAAELATSLGPLSSPGGRIVVEPEGNSIIAHDRPSVIEAMRAVVVSADRPHETLTADVRWIAAEEAARRVRELLGPSGTAFADAWRARVIIRDQPWRLQRVRAFIDSLDSAPTHSPAYLTLAHAETDSLGALVERLRAMQPGRTVTTVGASGLLVEDSPGGIDQVRSILAQVDSARTTIRVDAKILQVSVSREVSTGIDWQAIADKVDGLVLRGSFPMESSGPRLSIEVGDIADDDYTVLFSLLEVFGRVELISRPTLLTHSGREAELMVGSKVPYVTVDTREDNSGAVSRYQRVTYLPVGLSVWVKPKAHGDGTVSLEIRPELSSITGYVEAADTRYPIVETTNARLWATVPFGRSIVIGGLIRETTNLVSSGVPLLRSIPVLGALFRHQVEEVKRAELVILLTPTLAQAEVGG